MTNSAAQMVTLFALLVLPCSFVSLWVSGLLVSALLAGEGYSSHHARCTMVQCAAFNLLAVWPVFFPTGVSFTRSVQSVVAIVRPARESAPACAILYIFGKRQASGGGGGLPLACALLRFWRSAGWSCTMHVVGLSGLLAGYRLWPRVWGGYSSNPI